MYMTIHSVVVHPVTKNCMRASVVWRHISLNRVNRPSPDAVCYHKFLINYQRKTNESDRKCRTSAKLEDKTPALLNNAAREKERERERVNGRPWKKLSIHLKVFFSLCCFVLYLMAPSKWNVCKLFALFCFRCFASPITRQIVSLLFRHLKTYPKMIIIFFIARDWLSATFFSFLFILFSSHLCFFIFIYM